MNNKVRISGKVSSIEYSHESYDKKYYYLYLWDGSNKIPVIASEIIIQNSDVYVGKNILISGQFRSFNHNHNGEVHVDLFVFAQEILKYDGYKNSIELCGYICKQPTFRQTPFGRQISDVLLAVNRTYGKTDYIPVVVWGRNAKYASGLDVGDYVRIAGRIQSREYVKNNQTCVAYEVSAQTIEKLI